MDLEKRGKVTPECRRAWGHGTSLLYEPMLFSIPRARIFITSESRFCLLRMLCVDGCKHLN